MTRKHGIALAALLSLPSTAGAWEAATTHAGLTQQAAMASSLKRRLGELLGLSLGLWETIRLRPAGPAADDRLRARLSALDPSGGYAPADGRLTALGWLMAGSVVESVPVDRERNHFFDPTRGAGLVGGGLVSGFGRGLLAVSSGISSVRELFAGTSFDGSGMASTVWIVAPDNDLGLGRFIDARTRAVSAESAEERESAIAEALLAAGAILHVVEDEGDPAYVHNDFRTDLYARGAPFDRFVGVRWGRLGVPKPTGPGGEVKRLADLISNKEGTGLADRTARHFYSAGLLDDDAEAERRRYGLPPLIAGRQPTGYVLDAGKRRVARWWRDEAGRPRWELDERCYVDAASVLLPATVEAALGALEHLFRGSLSLDEGALKNGTVALGAGTVRLYAEGADGRRRVVSVIEVKTAESGASLLDVEESVRDQHLAAVFRGVDANGEPIVLSVERRAR